MRRGCRQYGRKTVFVNFLINIYTQNQGLFYFIKDILQRLYFQFQNHYSQWETKFTQLNLDQEMMVLFIFFIIKYLSFILSKNPWKENTSFFTITIFGIILMILLFDEKYKILEVSSQFQQYQYRFILMGLLSALKQAIYKLDLLSSGSLLRVKGQPEYRTLLGGFISIAVMVVLVAAFANKIFDTFDKLIITSSDGASNANDPTPLNITTIDSGPFMFGVEVWHHDLNNGPRYYDIVLTNMIYDYGQPSNRSVQYALQPCTRQHWNGFPMVQQNFENLKANFWMCLPKNMSFQIGGKYSSKLSKTLNVAAQVCTNNSFYSRPCAPQEDIDSAIADNGTNFFTIYFINPLINADQQQYLTYYLEDSNYIAFSSNGGEESRLFVEDYTINTDQSIFPFSDIRIQTGGVIGNSPLKSTYTTLTDTYAVFFFYKSPTSLTYIRSFMKLDEVFSYIGGLFGTVLMAFFLVNNYNTYKFEINLAGYLYKRQDKQAQNLQKSYNFIDFIGHLIYNVLTKFKFDPKWQKLCHYDKTRQQMLKQLDVLYLIKRINFLEKSLTFIFTDRQIKGLHLAGHITMKEAVHFRKNYKLKKKIKDEIQLKRQNNINRLQANFDLIDTNLNNQKGGKQKTTVQKQSGSFKNLNEIQNKDAENLQSDQYSSQSQSEEDQREVLSQIKKLQKEQKSNSLSKMIWKSVDKRIQLMMNPIVQQYASKQLENIEEDLSQNKIIQFDEDNNNNQVHNLYFLEGRVQDMNSQEDSQNQLGRTFAQNMFSKIQKIRPQSDLHN